MYVSRDGGRLWREVQLPRPPGLAEARTDYLAPRFETDGAGILAATYDNYEQRAVTVLYSTTDSGRHWKLAASSRLIVNGFGRIETERCNVTAKRAKCNDVNGLYFTADGGASWTPASRP